MAGEDEHDEEPVVEHQLKNRRRYKRLSEILCEFSYNLSAQDNVSRKVLAYVLTAVSNSQAAIGSFLY